MRRKLLIFAAVLLGITLLVIGSGLLYLVLGDHSGWRGTAEKLVSEALGRELEIRGSFEPRIRRRAVLVAEDISLANAEWGSEPAMVSVERLTVEADLISLLLGPLRIHRIEIEGARVLLEKEGTARANWHFDLPADTDGSAEAFDLAIERIDLRDLSLVYQDLMQEQGHQLTITELGCSTDESGNLALRLSGAFKDTGLELMAHLEPFSGLLTMGEIEHELALTLGELEISSRGRSQELASLDGVSLELDVHGPEISRITDIFDLPSLGQGPFAVTGRVSPSPQGSTVVLDATMGDLVAEAEGTVDSLARPTRVDLQVSTSGPDLEAAGALFGIAGAPAEDFAVNGRVLWQGFPVSFDAVELRVGENSFTIDGVLGEPPSLSGSELELIGSGPDLSALAALAGLDLPALPYRISGSLDRSEGGVAIEGAEAQLGAVHLGLSGRLGDPPEMHGTRLVVNASGPSLVPFRELAGVELPDQPFEIESVLIPTERGVRLDRAHLSLGSVEAQLSGEIVTGKGAEGSNLELRVTGRDISQLAWVHGRDGLPALPFKVIGKAGLEPGSLLLESMSASLGAIELLLDGRLGLAKGGAGTDLKLSLAGPDASAIAGIAGLEGIPKRPFQAAGGLRLEPGLVLTDRLDLSLGELELQISGRVAIENPLDGSELAVSGHGPRLADLGFLIDGTSLPEADFAVSGAVRTESGQLHLSEAVVTVAEHRAAVDGVVALTPGLAGSDLRFELGGPDLGELGRMAAATTGLPALPAEPYTARGDIEVQSEVCEIRSLHATLGRAEAVIEGRLGTVDQLHGSDLSILCNGPDASLFTALTGVTVPVAPFVVQGRVSHGDQGSSFHELRLSLGEYRADLDGKLGVAPHFVGSDLEIEISGPSLDLVEQLTGATNLPDLPFALSGSARGDPEHFQVPDLDLRLGSSDVNGFLDLTLSEPPRLEVRLQSESIDLGWLSGMAEQADEPAKSPADGDQPLDSLLSDRDLDLSWLHALDADVSWKVGRLQHPIAELLDLDMVLSLADGRLQLGPFTSLGERGGQVQGRIVLEPDADSYDLDAELSLSQGKIDLTEGTLSAAGSATSIDTLISLQVHGRSPHEMATSASGRVIVSLEGGAVNASILDFIAADLVLRLLEILNPLAVENQDRVGLECAVVVIEIDDGLVLLQPLALKTENVTILGHGAIDLDTEELDFEWVTKPRKGFGISASAITNPYVKLSGTLSEPVIEVKPLKAITSTGAAVATGGLSLLGKGLWDRVTAEGKVCKRCLKDAEKRLAGKKPRRRLTLFQ
jgi:uncharacterized protein involved in outer membrane biogenesis